MLALPDSTEHTVSEGSISHQFNVASSLAATFLRAGVGIATRPAAVRPAQLLELYEFEGCPHCRLVREVFTELDLDALVLPCPKGGTRHRRTVVERGGKAQFPFLIDPNAGIEMYESADIIRYLFDTYGQTSPPLHWRLVELQRLGSALAGIARLGSGVRARPSRPPAQPLVLYSFESSPFARLVRDRLCELELAYELRSVGRNTTSDWVPPNLRERLSIPAQPATRNRVELLERAGTLTVPYLVDPNTGAALSESAQIVAYLEDNYAE